MDSDFIKDLYKFIKEQEGNFSLTLGNGYEISVINLPDNNGYTIYVKRPNEDVFKGVGTVDDINLFREVFIGQGV